MATPPHTPANAPQAAPSAPSAALYLQQVRCALESQQDSISNAKSNQNIKYKIGTMIHAFNSLIGTMDGKKPSRMDIHVCTITMKFFSVDVPSLMACFPVNAGGVSKRIATRNRRAAAMINYTKFLGLMQDIVKKN
jgi:hypothetical protein